jgi:hypothetical protein
MSTTTFGEWDDWLAALHHADRHCHHCHHHLAPTSMMMMAMLTTKDE